MNFALTRVVITQAASGGHNIRARTGESFELQVSAYHTASAHLMCGIYPLKYIKVDTFNDTMMFVGTDNVTLLTVDGDIGTKIVIQSIGIWKNETSDNVNAVTEPHPIYGYTGEGKSSSADKAETLSNDGDGDFL